MNYQRGMSSSDIRRLHRHYEEWVSVWLLRHEKWCPYIGFESGFNIPCLMLYLLSVWVFQFCAFNNFICRKIQHFIHKYKQKDCISWFATCLIAPNPLKSCFTMVANLGDILWIHWSDVSQHFLVRFMIHTLWLIFKVELPDMSEDLKRIQMRSELTNITPIVWRWSHESWLLLYGRWSILFSPRWFPQLLFTRFVHPSFLSPSGRRIVAYFFDIIISTRSVISYILIFASYILLSQNFFQEYNRIIWFWFIYLCYIHMVQTSDSVKGIILKILYFCGTGVEYVNLKKRILNIFEQ